MDEKKLSQLMEDIEIFVQGTAKNNEKILQTLNELKNDPKQAQILIEAAKSINSTTETIKELISKENALIEGFNPKVEVKQTTLNVTVNKPLAWILGAVLVMVICGVTTYHFIQENSNLEARNAKLHKVDMKYRYLKVATFIKLDKFENTKQLTSSLDDYYSKSPNEVDSTVYSKEKQNREAFEAQEMARQQEAAAKQAIEEAKKLKQKADSLNAKTAN